MSRDVGAVGLLWLGLTAVGEAVVWNAPIFPGLYAREAEVSDSAFLLLMRLAVPVFAFVVAMLAVSVIRFRSRGEPQGPGAPIRGSRRAYALWLAVTGALTAVLIVNPGLVGLSEIRGEPDEDLVIQVQAVRWAWRVTYPEEGVTSTRELVLPVDSRIRFDVTSLDILHSFWIPGFRIKVDAVPGLTTTVRATTTQLGSFSEDPNLRVQCAELCGVGHAAMALPVRVVDRATFDAWIEERRTAAPAACEPDGTELRIAAERSLFETDCLAVPAGFPFTIEFDNRDAGVPHNVAIYTDQTAAQELFGGDIFAGVATRTYEVGRLEPGTYFFRCDVHPATMTGTFVVP